LTLPEFIKKLNHEVDRHEKQAMSRVMFERDGWIVKDRVIKHCWGYDDTYHELHFQCERLETDEEVLKRLKKNFKARLTKLNRDAKKAIEREEKERKEFERLKIKFG
jgi:hypothetical protein